MKAPKAMHHADATVRTGDGELKAAQAAHLRRMLEPVEQKKDTTPTRGQIDTRRRENLARNGRVLVEHLATTSPFVPPHHHRNRIDAISVPHVPDIALRTRANKLRAERAR